MTEEKPWWRGNKYKDAEGSLNFEGFFERPPEDKVDPYLVLKNGFNAIADDMTEAPLQKKWQAFMDSYKAIIDRLGLKSIDGELRYRTTNEKDLLFCNQVSKKFLLEFESSFREIEVENIQNPAQIKAYLESQENNLALSNELYAIQFMLRNLRDSKKDMSYELRDLLTTAAKNVDALRAYYHTQMHSASPSR